MDDTKELINKFETFINNRGEVPKGDSMGITKQKVIKYAFFAYWDKLQASQNGPLLALIAAPKGKMYGENQDFVNTTVAALMPSIGYVRSETVSVYFRAYKAKCRKVRQDLKSTLA